jgi:3-hydroxyacyl-[acyl-carrier-protein] dehydratase
MGAGSLPTSLPSSNLDPAAMDSFDPISFGLPHREPFIFIDQITAIEPGQTATCAKTFAASEPFFRGHFPGNPVVPGVLLTEALAQTAGIAAGTPSKQKSYRLSAIKLMKFLRAVPPDAQLTLRATKTGEVGGLLQFQVTALAENQAVAEGVIVLCEA